MPGKPLRVSTGEAESAEADATIRRMDGGCPLHGLSKSHIVNRAKVHSRFNRSKKSAWRESVRTAAAAVDNMAAARPLKPPKTGT